MTPARRCVCVISINLSIPLGGGAEEKLQVWIRTRPAPAYPTSIATLHDEAIAQMAIALRLITLAFEPCMVSMTGPTARHWELMVRIQLSPAPERWFADSRSSAFPPEEQPVL